jgi:hypothetical protein
MEKQYNHNLNSDFIVYYTEYISEESVASPFISILNLRTTAFPLNIVNSLLDSTVL